MTAGPARNQRLGRLMTMPDSPRTRHSRALSGLSPLKPAGRLAAITPRSAGGCTEWHRELTRRCALRPCSAAR